MKEMKAKFETSLGWVTINIICNENINEERKFNKEHPNIYIPYFDIDVIDNGDYIEKLYPESEIAHIRGDDFITYDIDDPIGLLRKQISQGQAWVYLYISDSDGTYGVPEYKLFEA